MLRAAVELNQDEELLKHIHEKSCSGIEVHIKIAIANVPSPNNHGWSVNDTVLR